MQVSMVQEFAKSNFLKLNCSKCETVLFSKRSVIPSLPYVFEDTHIQSVKRVNVLATGGAVAYLLLNNSYMKKARRVFFLYGSIGAFHGNLSLLSVSILESCVFPILLYESENWIMTEALMKMLESFQGELAKRILKRPKHHSNTAAMHSCSQVSNNEMLYFTT